MHIRWRNWELGIKYRMIDIEKERIITYYFEEDDIPVIYGMDSIVPVKIFEGEISLYFSILPFYNRKKGGNFYEYKYHFKIFTITAKKT